jgi:hypothetical protein
VGWNPENEQWEQILVVADEADEADAVVLKTASSMIDDTTGEPSPDVDLGPDPDNEAIVAFVWEYVEYTYPETERLYNVMDEALEELSTNGG